MDKVIKSENVDHIYCNKLKTKENLSYLDFKKSIFLSNDNTVKKMKNFILTNINLIEELQNQLLERDTLIAKLIAENESLKQRLQRVKKTNKKFEKDSNTNTVNANYNNNNSQPVNKKSSEKKSSEHARDKSTYETSDDEKKPATEDLQDLSISIKLSRKNLFLMTNQPYVINNWKTLNIEDEDVPKNFDEINLEVPRWTVVSTSPRRSEEKSATEDISDEAIQKRHAKFEVDERRRKKWDAQRIREQKNIERLRKRHLKEEYPELVQPTIKIPKTITSFFPNPESIKFIQISDDLPVSAFGEQIPKLQPKDFCLPWLSDTDDTSNIYSIDHMLNSGSKLKMRTKFISRCSRPITSNK
jgi:hypothetical protein